MTVVRAYTAPDYEQVVALYRNKRAYGGNFDVERDEPAKLAATAEQGNLYVAAADEEKVVGTFMILDNPHSFWLLRFAVDPDQPDVSEIAAQLFTKACDIAHERSHKSIIVYTDAEDTALNERYESLGCQKADVYRCYWKELGK